MSVSESRSAIVLQLAEEFLERYRQGQRPSLKEYIDCHPELADEIKDVFPAMALMENIALADESLAGEATGPATTTGAKPPQQLGDYRILREVGRGGMGIVYEAEQVSLGRHVALKVLPRKVLLDAAHKRRFEREARSAAKLHHTNIVPVFGVGEHDGLPYYVMQFIQGLGLDDVLDELKRIQVSGTATETDGQLRAPRKDVSVVDVARSLLTGAFPEGERGCVSAPSEPAEEEAALGALTQPRSAESDTSKLSDSFTLSSSLHLTSTGVKGKKLTYWQSVARLGVQMADALEYAHKQGIQHRDIKPSNLLLDTCGTVWVTDFGLARADNEDHLTQTGDIVGTLRYMPPEAFEGRADKRGDIYSLGLTMYEMLALQPAFAERDRRKLIKRVTSEEPARLDKLNPAIPRDLVTIVHKAIDREPYRRYGSAGALAADLQCFLDDEPIQARPISQTERLARWCRHHPGVATLTAVLTVILLAVTVASLLTAARFEWLAGQQAAAAESEGQARRVAEEAQEHESALREQAEEAKKQAESNLREAERQKQRAESNFAKAQKAVDDYFTTVSESHLLKVPGMQPLRRDLLQSALTFYQDFLKQRGDDPALRSELAAAYLRVGKIRSELGEGAEALKAYKQARELYEGLTKAAPESVEWRHGLAQCLYHLDRNEEAIALWEKLVQPGKPRFQKELADAYNIRAVDHSDAGRIAEMLKSHQQALAVREMLARLNPDDPDAQRDLGSTLNNIGVVLARKKRYADALVMYRRAAEHGEAAFARVPQVILNGRFVTVYQGNIANIERKLGHEKEALAAYRRVVEVWQKLTRDNPAVPSLHIELFNAYWSLAGYQRELKQKEPYERTMHLAREVLDRLTVTSAQGLFDLACIRSQFATFLAQGKEKATAEERAEQKHEADLAVAALRKAVAAGFRNLEQFRKAQALNPLRGREDFKALEADLAARAAEAPADKLKASQQALALHQKMAQADPKNKRLQADLAASQHDLALIQLDLGKREEAQTHLQQALTLREALVKDEPKNAQYQADLAASRFAVGDISWQSGRLAEGVKTWQRELDALEATARERRDRQLSGQLFALRRTVALNYLRAGLWSEAAVNSRFLILLEGATDPALDSYRAGCVALRAGDIAAYRRIVAQWVERVGDSEDLFRLYLCTWLTSLAEHSGVKPSQAIQWTRKSTRKNPPNKWWSCHVLGLAHYRAGQFAEAIAQASESNTLEPHHPPNIMNYPVLAMAHHHLGHIDESRKWLNQSTAEWRRLSPLMRSPSGLTTLPPTPRHWNEFPHDWLTFEILLREASVLIAGAPPVEHALDHVHQSLLYSRLGESRKAEAAWQAAVQIAPGEPRIYIVRARQLMESKRLMEAETVLAKTETFPSDNPDVWKERGSLYLELGQTEKAAADFRKVQTLIGQEKLKESQQAMAQREKLAQADPENKRLQADLAASHHAIALIQLDDGKWDEAGKNLEQATALREALAKDEPKNVQYQNDLAASRSALELSRGLPRARQLIESKHHKEAEAVLAKIEELPSKPLQVWKECGRLRFALGQTDKAAIDFRKAVQLLNENDKALVALALPSEPAASEADKLLARVADDALLARLTAAIERSPKDMAKRWNRGDWYARHARWKEAAPDFTTALEFRMAQESQPENKAWQWLYVSPILATGDPEGYRRLCREMLKRFGDTQNPTTADRIAKSCLLLPQSVQEAKRACELADRAVVLGKDHQLEIYFLLSKGLADYRRGDFYAAIKGLDPLATRFELLSDEKTIRHLLLAMALHRQGNAQAAREHLTRAAGLLELYLLDPVRFPILKNSQYYIDWLIAWLLHREAQTLIEGEKGKSKK